MPLLEIIKGEKTSDAAVYRALDLAKQIKKTPIVVNDSRGFFTSRVIGTFLNEGMAMLGEGVPPPSIEQASSQAGYPAPLLQLSDELNLKLMRRIRNASKAATEAEGGTWAAHPAEAVIDRMLDGRAPRQARGRGLLRVRRRQAHAAVAGPARGLPAGRGPVARSTSATSRSGCSSSRPSRRSSASTRASSSRSPTPTSARSWASATRAGAAASCSTSTVTRAACRASWPARASSPTTYGDRFTPPDSLVQRAERGEAYYDEEVLATV